MAVGDLYVASANEIVVGAGQPDVTSFAGGVSGWSIGYVEVGTKKRDARS